MSRAAQKSRLPHLAIAWVIGMPLVLSGCGGSREEDTVRPDAAVQVASVASRDFNDVVVAYGVVEAPAATARAVSVQVESVLTQLQVEQGEAVKRGQALARLEPSATTLLEAQRAERDAQAAQAELLRVEHLRVQALATESELQAARATAASAAALRASLAARVGPPGGLELTAPVSGVIDGLAARVGEILAAGSVVVRILQPASPLVRLGVEPAALAGLAQGALVQLADLQGQVAGTGRIVGIDRRVDPQSGLAGLLVRAQDAVTVASGTRVRAQIIRATHRQVPGVPRSAVQRDGAEAYVFVADAGKAQRRVVHLGYDEADEVEITEGLKPGERVVVLGNDELTDGMAIHVDKAAAQGPSS
jgi:RND family efflux transporter MFP subunit